MSSILNIIGFVLLGILVILVICVLVFSLHFLVWFQWRTCKYCGHFLEYKGLKEDDEEGHFLFHCPHCDSWEKVPKKDFLNDIDEGYNPNRLRYD